MDADALMTIVREEGLDQPVLEGHGVLRNEAVVLQRGGSGWTVFLANERGGRISSTVREFENRSDALEHVLEKLRQTARAREAMARLRARRAAADG